MQHLKMAEISWDGSQSNAGRKKHEAPRSLQIRMVRISIYHLQWKTIKKKADKSTGVLVKQGMNEMERNNEMEITRDRGLH